MSQRISIHREQAFAQECLVLVRQIHLGYLYVDIFVKLFLVISRKVCGIVGCAIQFVVCNIVAGLESVTLVYLMVDTAAESSEELIVW